VRAAGDLLTAQMQAVDAVQQALSKLGTAAAAMANTIRADRCLHCVGAGSAGLAADADAEELGATCSIPVRQVRIHVAGGLLTGVDMPGDVEDREDGITGNFADLAVGDTVICVSASGSTPYTLAAADLADNRGVTLIAFANNPEAQLLSQTDHAILLPTPPERVAGSTCLGAGKAQKVALNILSTLMGSCLGHIHDGMMINRRADNAKLHDRALRIVGRIARVPAHVAQETLEICKGDVKTAILVAKRGILRMMHRPRWRKPMGICGRPCHLQRPRNSSLAKEMRSMKHALLKLALLGTFLVSTGAGAQNATLTIESWRNDDLLIWQNMIIPAFEAQHPDIAVEFTPSAPTEYNAALNSKLAGGTAGDLITCRPFDASLVLYEQGHLVDLDDMDAMQNFSAVAKSAWQTDDGSATFCVPMASVIHGFIYNADAFAELGLGVPETEDEFFAVLDAIKADGSYIPMSMGTNDQWEAATMGYQNIGPNYWKGEEGRQALIHGGQKLTDEMWVAPYRVLARWSDYLGDGYEAQTYPDSQNLFTLGRAAIYPAGSWEIAGFNSQADFAMGVFKPPVRNAGDTCYISDHTDIGIGLNAASSNQEAARTFLAWVGSPEFATIFGNALPGFFPLSSTPVALEDPLANEFVSWRGECESTIRSTYQILSRGTPNLETGTWGASVAAIRGTMTPEEVSADLQEGLASWYAPHQ